MTEQQRNLLIQLITNSAREQNNPINMPKVGSLIHSNPEAEALWQEVKSSYGSKMLRLVSDLTPQLQVVTNRAPDANPGAQPSVQVMDLPVNVPGDWQSRLNDEERQAVIRFVLSMIRETGGAVPLTAITPRFATDLRMTVLRRRFPSLADMLDCLAPDLVIFTEANGADCIREGEPAPEPAAQAPAQNPSLMLEGYPAYVDPQSDEAVAAVSEMHRFAFMGWWNNTSRTLRKLTGYRGNDQQVWCAILALTWKKVHDADGFIYLSAKIDGSPEQLCLFDSGLIALDGQKLYCVLIENPVPDHQPWTLAEFTNLADPESKYAPVLMQELGYAPVQTAVQPRHMLRLSQMLTALSHLQEGVAPSFERLRQGYLLEGEQISAMQAYLSRMDELVRSGFLRLTGIADPMGQTLESLVGEFGAGQFLGSLSRFEEHFAHVLDRADQFFRVTLSVNTADPAHPVARCRDFLKAAGEDLRGGGAPQAYLPRYRQWLDQFAGLTRLLWNGEKDLCEPVSAAFRQSAQLLGILSDSFTADKSASAQALSDLNAAEAALSEFSQSLLSAEEPAPVQDSDEPQAEPDAASSEAQDAALDEIDIDSLVAELTGFDIPAAPVTPAAPEAAAPEAEAILPAQEAEEEEVPAEAADLPVQEPAEETPAPEPSGEERALPEALDGQLMAACESGEMEPELTLLSFGPWEMKSAKEGAPRASQTDTAWDLLTRPQTRNWDDLCLCIQRALLSGQTEQAEWLTRPLPEGTRRRLYVFLTRAQTMLREPENADTLQYDLCRLMGDMLEDSSLAWAQSTTLSAVILAHVPLLISRRFQIDSLADLQSVLTAQRAKAWLPLQVPAGELKRLFDLIGEDRADPNYRLGRSDVSAVLRMVHNQQNHAAAIARLRQTALVLEDQFANDHNAYKNARLVIQAMTSQEKSPRTWAMLQSLKAGRPVSDEARPFEDERDIMDYANGLQGVVLDLKRVAPIVSSSRTHIISTVSALNSAYLELLELSGSAQALPEETMAWYQEVLSALSAFTQKAKAHVQTLPDSPLRKYLNELCTRGLWDAPASEAGKGASPLTLTYGGGESWPLFQEDRLVAALFGQCGRTGLLTTLPLCAGEAEPEAMDKCLRALEQRCLGLAGDLSGLKWANAINEDEYESLSQCLSRDVGWIRRARAQLAEGEMAESLYPPLRYELEATFVDEQIAHIFARVKDSVIEAVSASLSGEDQAQLAAQITATAESRDIAGLMERFSDTVTEIAALDEKESPSALFATRDVLDTLCAAVAVEKWRKGSVVGIGGIYEKLRALRTLSADSTPDQTEIMRVGSGVAVLTRFGAEGAASLNDKNTPTIAALFEFLGFTQPQIRPQEDVLVMTFGAQDRTICPLPSLGRSISFNDAGSGRLSVRYDIRVMQDISAVSDLLSAAAVGMNTTPTILFCPFAIPFEQRRALITLARESESSHPFFLLDLCFLRFAMCLTQSERIKAFYGCCASLMRLYPYNVNTVLTAGDGVFYGRSGEIDRLMNTRGASVIYGGRRLGKTSIMRETEWRWLAASPDNLAVYLDLKSEATPENTLWYLIARNLSGSIPALQRYRTPASSLMEIAVDAQGVIQEITRFLGAGRGKLLLLIDESDNLVYRDTLRYQKNPEVGSRISEVIRLINQNEGRVNVVLAGLDRVTRFVRSLNAYSMPLDPNWELFQRFCTTIQLRPMLGSDMPNAYDLVDIPFKIMGYRLEKRSIVYILRISCFRPNLIQNYCMHLLESVRTLRDVAFEEDSLLMHIPHERVVSIYEAQTGNAQFHDAQKEQSVTIPLNVGVTLVYAPVAYAVALMSLKDSASGMFTGFAPGAVLDELLAHDARFADNTVSALAYITTILNDLSAMGILRHIQFGGVSRYALFSNYMLRMLGDEDSIEAMLTRSLSTYIERNSAASEELSEMYADRFVADHTFFPLTIGQLEAFNSALCEEGCAVAVGSEMLRLSSLPGMLESLRFMGTRHPVRELTGEEFAAMSLDSLYASDSTEASPILVITDGWTGETVSALLSAHQANADVMAVLLAPPALCRQQPELLASLPRKLLVHLTRLEASFRNNWVEQMLEQTGRSEGADASALSAAGEKAGELTGDWPELAVRLRAHLQAADGASFAQATETFAAQIQSDAPAIWAQMGMDQVSREIWEAISSFDSLRDCLEYAESLGVVAPDVLRTVEYLRHLNVLDLSLELSNTDEALERLKTRDCSYRVNAFAIRLGKVVADR